MGPVGRVVSSGRVRLFGLVELCDFVSTLGSLGRVGPFGHVGSCGCVSTSGPFSRVGPVGHSVFRLDAGVASYCTTKKRSTG